MNIKVVPDAGVPAGDAWILPEEVMVEIRYLAIHVAAGQMTLKDAMARLADTFGRRAAEIVLIKNIGKE